MDVISQLFSLKFSRLCFHDERNIGILIKQTKILPKMWEQTWLIFELLETNFHNKLNSKWVTVSILFLIELIYDDQMQQFLWSVYISLLYC